MPALLPQTFLLQMFLPKHKKNVQLFSYLKKTSSKRPAFLFGPWLITQAGFYRKKNSLIPIIMPKFSKSDGTELVIIKRALVIIHSHAVKGETRSCVIICMYVAKSCPRSLARVINSCFAKRCFAKYGFFSLKMSA